MTLEPSAHFWYLVVHGAFLRNNGSWAKPTLFLAQSPRISENKVLSIHLKHSRSGSIANRGSLQQKALTLSPLLAVGNSSSGENSIQHVSPLSRWLSVRQDLPRSRVIETSWQPFIRINWHTTCQAKLPSKTPGFLLTNITGHLFISRFAGKKLRLILAN